MERKSNPIIQTYGLGKNYGQITALKNLSLNVEAHQIVGFLGPNGAGKSTTIKILLGLTKASSGGGTIFGFDIDKENPKVRQRIGYLAQNPCFYDYMNAREILNFTAHFFYDGPQAEINKRIQETLELVGLADKADRAVRGFSGGERQRLGIAQAQINYPDLLILDEPAAALDPMGRRDVLEIMERLRKYATIFFSTHILDDVQRVSDQVIILNKGQLVTQGSIEDLLMSKEGLVYQILFKGDAYFTKNRLSGLPWIKQIRTEQENGHHKLLVNVLDEETAEKDLLRVILADENIKVTAFQQSKLNLEEAFLQLVEGE